LLQTSLVAFFLFNIFFSFISAIELTDIQHLPTVNGCIKDYCFTLDHANTYEKKVKGLMYVTNLATTNGMLFSWPNEQPIYMWMKNTYIPLDIIWLNSNFKIVHIEHEATPFDLTPLMATSNAQYIIEINGGLANDYLFKPGDTVYFKN